MPMHITNPMHPDFKPPTQKPIITNSKQAMEEAKRKASQQPAKKATLPPPKTNAKPKPTYTIPKNNPASQDFKPPAQQPKPVYIPPPPAPIDYRTLNPMADRIPTYMPASPSYTKQTQGPEYIQYIGAGPSQMKLQNERSYVDTIGNNYNALADRLGIDLNAPSKPTSAIPTHYISAPHDYRTLNPMADRIPTSSPASPYYKPTQNTVDYIVPPATNPASEYFVPPQSPIQGPMYIPRPVTDEPTYPMSFDELRENVRKKLQHETDLQNMNPMAHMIPYYMNPMSRMPTAPIPKSLSPTDWQNQSKLEKREEIRRKRGNDFLTFQEIEEFGLDPVKPKATISQHYVPRPYNYDTDNEMLHVDDIIKKGTHLANDVTLAKDERNKMIDDMLALVRSMQMRGSVNYRTDEMEENPSYKKQLKELEKKLYDMSSEGAFTRNFMDGLTLGLISKAYDEQEYKDLQMLGQYYHPVASGAGNFIGSAIPYAVAAAVTKQVPGLGGALGRAGSGVSKFTGGMLSPATATRLVTGSAMNAVPNAVRASSDSDNVAEFAQNFGKATLQDLGGDLAYEGLYKGFKYAKNLFNSKNPLDLHKGLDYNGNKVTIPKYLDVVDDKVGGKVPVNYYCSLREISVKNKDADSIMLGKFTPTIENGVKDWTKAGPDSYVAKAGKDSLYFDLGSEWDVVRNKYNLTYDEMFDYFNKPVLDDVIKSGKDIKFSHDPRDFPDSFLADEWKYIKEQLGLTDNNLVFKGDMWYVK